MRRLLPLIILAVAVTASAAFAADGGGQGQSPAQQCKAELAVMGAANFKALYSPGGSGENAMGKCVSKHAQAAAANRTNAAKACKAEQALPEADFRAAHDGKQCFLLHLMALPLARTPPHAADPRGYLSGPV